MSKKTQDHEPKPTLKEDDVVRVKDAQRYVAAFAKKVADRDAVVLWVGPRANGMFEGQAKVRFQKRNGRGKEFEEILRITDLVLQEHTGDAGAVENPQEAK